MYKFSIRPAAVRRAAEIFRRSLHTLNLNGWDVREFASSAENFHDAAG
jgi:hypothetical protein